MLVNREKSTVCARAHLGRVFEHGLGNLLAPAAVPPITSDEPQGNSLGATRPNAGQTLELADETLERFRIVEAGHVWQHNIPQNTVVFQPVRKRQAPPSLQRIEQPRRFPIRRRLAVLESLDAMDIEIERTIGVFARGAGLHEFVERVGQPFFRGRRSPLSRTGSRQGEIVRGQVVRLTE